MKGETGRISDIRFDDDEAIMAGTNDGLQVLMVSQITIDRVEAEQVEEFCCLRSLSDTKAIVIKKNEKNCIGERSLYKQK